MNFPLVSRRRYERELDASQQRAEELGRQRDVSLRLASAAERAVVRYRGDLERWTAEVAELGPVSSAEIPHHPGDLRTRFCADVSDGVLRRLRGGVLDRRDMDGFIRVLGDVFARQALERYAKR